MSTSGKNGQAPGGMFEPQQVVLEPVVRAPRESLLVGHLLFTGDGGFAVGIPPPVADRLAVFAELAAPREWLGMLAGLHCEDERGAYVVVLGVVPDTEAKTDAVSVLSTHESELRTRLALRTLYPDGTSVGWVHSHPGYGTTFSGTDMRTQASWRAPHALGIVVDPTRAGADQFGVYRGPGAERLAYAGLGAGSQAERTRTPAEVSLRAALITLASAIVTGVELVVDASVPVVRAAATRYAEVRRPARSA